MKILALAGQLCIRTPLIKLCMALPKQFRVPDPISITRLNIYKIIPALFIELVSLVKSSQIFSHSISILNKINVCSSKYVCICIVYLCRFHLSKTSPFTSSNNIFNARLVEKRKLKSLWNLFCRMCLHNLSLILCT